MNRSQLWLTNAATGLCVALGAASMAQANQRIPLSAALAQCDTQSTRYSRQIVDRAGSTPSQDRLDRHYRSCVYAKSGQYPPKTNRPSGLRLSGSVSLGIVVGN